MKFQSLNRIVFLASLFFACQTVFSQSTMSALDVLETRFEAPMLSADCSTCVLRSCDTPENCGGTNPADQLASIQSIQDQIRQDIAEGRDVPCVVEGQPSTQMQYFIKPEMISLPVDIIKVMLCDGSEVFIYAEYEDMIIGGYEIVDRILVTSRAQLLAKRYRF